MTTHRYQIGCDAGSQVRGSASADAWIVNFNNGNANTNNRNNDAFVRAVRSASPAGECQGNVSLRALHAAWKAARRAKRPSGNQLAFDTRWLDGLIRLQHQLQSGTWQPRPTTCFIATRPKAREIHAPDFADRVVHHWLVPQLEAIYEPRFIHDSYANRQGKGTHAAVRRLRDFVHQVDSGQGSGWYLQLDVHNFFNSIHRPTLYTLLKRRMQRHGISEAARRATHALLAKPVGAQGVIYRATPAERDQVPAHKRLENAAPGCGLPIGNLSSQFFANVYLDRLDQFCKHTLKAQRYLRYVDDFVLVHHDRGTLEHWRDRIEAFLRDELRLRLKPDQRLRPLSAGIDFLGYVLYPTHTLVRPRVVRHLTGALSTWEREHVRGRNLRTTPNALERIRAVWASYEGHLQHADAQGLRRALNARFPWLQSATGVRRRFPFSAMTRPLWIGIR